jgi:Putative restriction endonuclease
MADTLRRPMSLADFLLWEAKQPAKHEFVDGRICAMSGGTRRHHQIGGNVFAFLRARQWRDGAGRHLRL